MTRLYWHWQGLRPWHEITKPQKAALNIEDHPLFVDYLSEWDAESFLHLAVSDEFFIYVTRKPNIQNDRIWEKTPDDIPKEEHYHKVVKSPDCVGMSDEAEGPELGR